MKAKLFGHSKAKPQQPPDSQSASSSLSLSDPSSLHHSQRSQAQGDPRQINPPQSYRFGSQSTGNTLTKRPPPGLQTIQQQQRQGSFPGNYDEPPTGSETSLPPYTQTPPIEDRAHRLSGYIPGLHSDKDQKKGLREGFREKIGFGGATAASPRADQQGALQVKGGGVGRSLSLRKRSSATQEKFRPNSDQQSQWPLGPESSSPSLAQQEEEEEQHNTFQAPAEYQGAPPVPEKDNLAHEQFYRQADILSGRPQDYYPPPPEPLQRINTDVSFNGADVYSPAYQHPAYAQEQQYKQYQELQQDQFAHPGQVESHQTHYPPPPGHPPAQQYQPSQQNQEAVPSYTPSAQAESDQQHSQHQQQQFQSERAVAPPTHTQSAGLQHSTNQDPLFLQPPPPLLADTSSVPPSPLQVEPIEGRLQKLPLAATQETSPSDNTSAPASMPRDTSRDTPRESQSRGGNNTIRQVDSKSVPPSASREGSGYSQQGIHLGAGPAQAGPPPGQGRPLLPPPGDDAGRESPAPPMDFSEEDAAHYQQLKKEYRDLREKYNRVKRFYFEMEEQVHKLQNTIARQRLSQSKTSLDDSEYATRFNRLEGLISQLSFSIRKSWKAIPDFLARVVNKEAVAVGKQEMTAVGRAFISYWLVSELFDKCFHPDLDRQSSLQLKHIANNIRRHTAPFQSGEEEEALNSKIISWRLTTIEGLQDRLKSPEAAEHQQRLIAYLNEKLIADMSVLLIDPTPPDLEGGIHMIVELAVKIASHLPLESRDVTIEYFLPFQPVLGEFMRIETGVPPLLNPLTGDGNYEGSDSKNAKGHLDDLDRASVNTSSSGAPDDGHDMGKKRGMLSGFMGGGANPKKPSLSSTGSGPSPAPGKPGSSTTPTGPGGPLNATGRETPTQEIKDQRIRMSVGVCVKIRGKSVLTKSPCYCLS